METESKISSGLLADRLDRFIAFNIDQIVTIIVFTPIIVTLLVVDLVDEKQLIALNATIFKEIVGLVFFLVLNAYLIRNYSQTIGKAVMGLTIVDDQFRPASASSIVLRYGFFYALSMIPFVGLGLGLIDLLFVFGKERMCLHDYFAATKVVYSKKMAKTTNSHVFNKAKKSAQKILSNPVYVEDYCEQQSLSLNEVNEKIERGELDAYETSGFLFVDDKS